MHLLHLQVGTRPLLNTGCILSLLACVFFCPFVHTPTRFAQYARTHARTHANRLPRRQIPNQTLLHFFGAHALKYGIAMRGGVNDCADWLGVQAIPGKWSVALQEDEVAQLRKDGKLGGGDIERGFSLRCFDAELWL